MSAGDLTLAWSGLEETVDAISELEQAVQDAIVAAQTRYGQTATALMKANHANDAHEIKRYVNRTWDLTNSIAFAVAQWAGDLSTLTMEAGRDLDYAEAVEQGTSHSRAYPFFWLQVYAGQPVAEKDVYDSVLLILQTQDARVAAEA